MFLVGFFFFLMATVTHLENRDVKTIKIKSFDMKPWGITIVNFMIPSFSHFYVFIWERK